jgi:hypothetical protein
MWCDKHRHQVVIGLDGITSEFQTLFAHDNMEMSIQLEKASMLRERRNSR